MTYKIELMPSPDGYLVACPEFPNCTSKGETQEEAISNITHAIAFRLKLTPPNSEKEVRFIEVAPAEVAKPLEPFRVTPFKMGLTPEWTSGKIDDLLDLMEGPDRKW